MFFLNKRHSRSDNIETCNTYLISEKNMHRYYMGKRGVMWSYWT